MRVYVFGNIEFVTMEKKEKWEKNARTDMCRWTKTKRVYRKEYLHTCSNDGEGEKAQFKAKPPRIYKILTFQYKFKIVPYAFEKCGM